MEELPDGDVFGERIDGSWREAAERMQAGDFDRESLEDAIELGLRRWHKQWLNGRMMLANKYAEELCALTADSNPMAITRLIERFDRIAYKADFGERIMLDAAKEMASDYETLIGASLPSVQARLYSRTLEVAAIQGFIYPAINGAVREGHLKAGEAVALGESLTSRVDKLAESAQRQIEQDPSRSRVVLTSGKRPQKRSTADLLHEPLR